MDFPFSETPAFHSLIMTYSRSINIFKIFKYYCNYVIFKIDHFVTRIISILKKSNYKYAMKHKIPCEISKRN